MPITQNTLSLWQFMGDDASGRLSLSERLSTISLPFSILVCIKKHSRNNFATSEMP